MPHNEPCPACGGTVPDWHWEWYEEPSYTEIYRGTAGMDCPLCGALVMYAGTAIPLTAYPHGGQVQGLKREVIKAATWTRVCNLGMSLENYLQTAEGKPYANYWPCVEVQQADQQAATSP